MCDALQIGAVYIHGEQVSVGLKLVRQGDLLCRVAGKVAGEHYALSVCRELGMVGEASVRVEHPPQPTAIRPHLHSAGTFTISPPASNLRVSACRRRMAIKDVLSTSFICHE